MYEVVVDEMNVVLDELDVAEAANNEYRSRLNEMEDWKAEVLKNHELLTACVVSSTNKED